LSKRRSLAVIRGSFERAQRALNVSCYKFSVTGLVSKSVTVFPPSCAHDPHAPITQHATHTPHEQHYRHDAHLTGTFTFSDPVHSTRQRHRRATSRPFTSIATFPAPLPTTHMHPTTLPTRPQAQDTHREIEGIVARPPTRPRGRLRPYSHTG